MKTKRTIGLVVVSLALILSILACGGGTAPSPTAAQPQPSATEASVEKPTATPKPTKAAKATATPIELSSSPSSGCPDVAEGELGVGPVLYYLDTMDAWRVIGLVCNKTAGAVANIQMTVELFDKAGKSLYKQEKVYTALDNVAAGEETPFSLDVYDAIAAPDAVKATITASDKADLKRTKIDTQGIVMTVDDQGNVHLTGELINNGSDPVQVHNVAATTFDKDGKMFTADYSTVLKHYMGTGGTAPFRITMSGPKDGASRLDHYTLYLDVETSDPQESLINAKDDLTDLTDYIDNYGQFHLVGEITNSAQKNIGVRLVATIYDKDKNVIDASEMDTAISAIKPGETIPYEFNYWGPLNDKKGVYDAYATYKVQVDPTWTWTTDSELFDLKTQKDAVEWDTYQGTFKGEVLNDTGGDLESAVVMVGIYGKTGQPDANKLLAMNYQYADIKDNKLANGQSAPYSIGVSIPKDFNSANYEYRIIVKGKKP